MMSSGTERIPKSIAVLLSALYACVVALSLKCAVDLLGYADWFPGWFVPAFNLGLAVLLIYTGTMVYRVWKVRDTMCWTGRGNAVAIWCLLPLAVVCTTSVHQFRPFRLSFVLGLSSWNWGALGNLSWGAIGSPEWAYETNMALAFFGVFSSACAAGLYGLGRRRAALVVLLGSGFLLLVPNDTCMNPFNAWWIDTIGTSPLMYVPVIVANVLGCAALMGVNTRLNMLGLIAVEFFVLLLGLGHMFRIIW